MLKHGSIDPSEAEGPGKIGEVSQRQDRGELLRPTGKVFKREEGPAKKKHGGDEEKHRQVKHIDGPHDACKEHANGCKSKPPQESKREDQQPPGIADQPEKTDNHQHDGGGGEIGTKLLQRPPLPTTLFESQGELGLHRWGRKRGLEGFWLKELKGSPESFLTRSILISLSMPGEATCRKRPNVWTAKGRT